MEGASAITNLLYRYAELIDSGDFAGTAALFAEARVMVGEDWLEGAAPLQALWEKTVRLYPCGTPRTKHVITNPIVEIDEAAGMATCRSYYTVIQATDALPLQVICAGRYHDSFVRRDGSWRFATRNYSLFDLAGDMSAHLLRMI
jgi:3-phenylpropionate/cinnamic acid dioxygenase small subunit